MERIPPDAYLADGDNHKIAVEVSTLVQHMHDGDRAISREGVDDATLKLAPELEAQKDRNAYSRRFSVAYWTSSHTVAPVQQDETPASKRAS